MPATIQSPQCLHIPALYAGETALIYWKEVPGAAGYVLEGCFDVAPDDDGTGRSWIHWDTDGKSWDDCDEVAQSWLQKEEAPADYTLFHGLGEEVMFLDENYTWQALDGLDLCWADSDALDLNWHQWETRAAPGMTWENLDARWLAWDVLDELALTWEEFDWLAPDTGMHRGVEFAVPHIVEDAWFFVRAADANGDISPALATVRLPVIATETIALAARSGERNVTQLDGRLVKRLDGVKLRLLHDPAALRLENSFLPGGQIGYTTHMLPQVTCEMPGVLELVPNRAPGSGQAESAAIARACFAAMAGDATELRLERTRVGESHAV